MGAAGRDGRGPPSPARSPGRHSLSASSFLPPLGSAGRRLRGQRRGSRLDPALLASGPVAQGITLGTAAAPPGQSELFTRVNPGAPEVAVSHTSVPGLGRARTSLTPPPPGSPSRSLSPFRSSRAGGWPRWPLEAFVPSPAEALSQVSGWGVGQTSGVRSQLLPPSRVF